jgi:hypothetical protein
LVFVQVRVVMLRVDVVVYSIDTVEAMVSCNSAVVAAAVSKLDDGVVICKLSEFGFANTNALVYIPLGQSRICKKKCFGWSEA